MKRYLKRSAAGCIILSALLLLPACNDDKNTLETEKDLSEYTTCEHILDSTDAAYEQGYTKFRLPEKDALHITAPGGVYKLTLEYANKENDTEWKTERVLSLQEVFGADYGKSVNTANGNAVLGDPDRACVGIGICDAYAFKEWDGYTVSIFNRSSLDSIETININPKTKKQMPGDLLECIDKSEEISNKAADVMDDDLDAKAYDAYIFKNSRGTGYGVEMQKCYKGIGILNLQYANMNDEDFASDNALLTMAMQHYIYFDEKNDMFYYRSCDSFKVKSKESIDSVLSFKGACDLLERELGDNSYYEFDDVVLMYEPRGRYIGETFDGTETVTCTPKWYFIKYTADYEKNWQHQIRFFSIDCESGTIEAHW